MREWKREIKVDTFPFSSLLQRLCLEYNTLPQTSGVSVFKVIFCAFAFIQHKGWQDRQETRGERQRGMERKSPKPNQGCCNCMASVQTTRPPRHPVCGYFNLLRAQTTYCMYICLPVSIYFLSSLSIYFLPQMAVDIPAACWWHTGWVVESCRVHPDYRPGTRSYPEHHRALHQFQTTKVAEPPQLGSWLVATETRRTSKPSSQTGRNPLVSSCGPWKWSLQTMSTKYYNYQ